MLPKGERRDVFSSRAVGRGIEPKERPQIANVVIADLDQDGLADMLVCDILRNQVGWIRQFPRDVYTEIPIGPPIAAPAHVQAIDIDGDGDVDLVVASLGVLFPSNARIGSVVILENDGQQHFTVHIVADHVARVADVRAGDLDGDGDNDLAVAGFGYDDGETMWLENRGGWQFEPHLLQHLSGPINAEIVDIDGDGDLDIVSLVSQEWEEIWAFVNDGRGHFTAKLVWGAANADFGSSWITIVDLNRDGRPDVLYSNGDAFDYAPANRRPWHGVQWLENKGNAQFDYHRIADFSGASSPQAADIDGDGDLDVVVVSAYNTWDSPAAQSLVWLENDGRMHFTMHDLASTPTHLITLAIGDVNGDGRPDLVTGGMHISRPYDRLSRLTLWLNHWPPRP